MKVITKQLEEKIKKELKKLTQQKNVKSKKNN